MSFVRTTLKISGVISRLLPGLAAVAFLVASLVGALKTAKEKKEQR